jgi:hypothetical protein
LNGLLVHFQKELVMGKNEAARQRQLAKKKAKRGNKRKEIARRTSTDPTVALAHIDRAPVYGAHIPENLGSGIGICLLARRLSDGRVALASYLVDTFCLGVKDTYVRIQSPADYKEFLDRADQAGRMREVSGACLAKLVLGAVAFARRFGLSPHEDFRHSGKLLEGINTSTCTEEFEYGRNGKPLFVQGPHDSPAKIARIMAQMTEAGGLPEIAVGPGGLSSLSEMHEAFLDEDDDALQIRIEDSGLSHDDLLDMSDPDANER